MKQIREIRTKIRKNAFRSVYTAIPVEPPNTYFLSSYHAARALGVSNDVLARWRKTYRSTTGERVGPTPVRMESGKNHVWRYRREDVLGQPEGTWLAEFRAQRRAWIERTALRDGVYHKAKLSPARAKAYRARRAQKAVA